jgi:hypothetical protein
VTRSGGFRVLWFEDPSLTDKVPATRITSGHTPTHVKKDQALLRALRPVGIVHLSPNSPIGQKGFSSTSFSLRGR